ncbi:MAG: LuxR C-terminal-related transcriptional regulator [Cyclobacteriaceae bacterium]
MKKSWLIYGSLMGFLMIVLEVTHYKAFVKDIQIELFGAVVGILFMLIGVWLGMTWYKKKNNIERYDPSKLGLSQREVEVLELLSQGYSNQEIADKLFVSLNTIKTHISKIYQKLNAKRRTQAIQKARELALIAPSSE